MKLLHLPGKLVAFVLCMPFKAVGAVLRFSLRTRSLKDYFEKRFEEKRLRQVMKVGGKSMAFVEAARSGHLKMVDALLQSGVPADARGRALIAAASGGNVEVCRRLLQAGAAVNTRDARGMTPLIHAAWAGKLSVMRLLLEAGADVNAQDHEHGWTPLLALLAEPHSEWLYEPAAEALLQAGADASVKGKDGRSALDWARGRRVAKLAHLFGDPSFVARNDMQHDVFGAISYVSREQIWIGKCSLPYFAEYGSGADLAALSAPDADFRQGLFRLSIRDATGDGPTSQQAHTFQFLKQHEAQAFDAVMAALLQSANYDARPPKYQSAAELKPLARCTGVEFSTEFAGTHAYCGFSFENTWEIEHGLTVVFHPEKRAFWGDSTALDCIG